MNKNAIDAIIQNDMTMNVMSGFQNHNIWMPELIIFLIANDILVCKLYVIKFLVSPKITRYFFE